jgi:hypothetical protein
MDWTFRNLCENGFQLQALLNTTTLFNLRGNLLAKSNHLLAKAKK